VARDTDFLQLYRDLGLTPDCGLIEFKQAYRRRLAVLHPDRQTAATAAAPAELQRLNAIYGAAMEFQRRHGRLPGAAQVRPARGVKPGRSSRPAIAPAPNGHSRRMLGLLGVSAAIWLLWNNEPSPQPTHAAPPTAASTHPTAAPAKAGASLRPLAAGASEDAVRAAEGEPLIMSDGRWEYGPSWVRFEDHKVVQWYSSPLRPLKSASPSPASPP
jgi:curved DNA-binding protein CbpA